MFSKALFALTAIAVAVNAQSSSSPPAPTSSPTESSSSPPAPTSSPSDSSCIYACIIPAAIQNGCSGIEDLPCVCTNSQFQADAGGCLQQHCPAGDLQGALQLQSQACAAGGLTPSFTATPTPRPVSFTLVPVSSTGSRSGSSVPSPSSLAGPSVSRSATASVVAASHTPSTAAGTSTQASAGAIFGAIFAAVFAL